MAKSLVWTPTRRGTEARCHIFLCINDRELNRKPADFLAGLFSNLSIKYERAGFMSAPTWEPEGFRTLNIYSHSNKVNLSTLYFESF